MGLVKFWCSDDEDKMIEELKKHFNTTTKTKVVRSCIKNTYEMAKTDWGDKP